jgi:hypothetical protein
MKHKILILLTLMCVTSFTYAYRESFSGSWTIDAAFGMGFYPATNIDNDHAAVGRLDIGYTLFKQPYWQAGIEAGVQNGNTLRLNIPKESIDILGGVPIEAQIKPMLDVLIDVKTATLADTPIIGWFKGGVAYRQLTVDHAEVNNLSEFAPEIQAGLGYQFNDQATITIGYQLIWGKNPELTVNPLAEIGVLNYLPTQQAVMIGFSFGFL